MPGVRLTADQRLVIERAYLAGLPQATIAALVGKHPSTISRELRRAGSFGTRSPRRRTARDGGRREWTTLARRSAVRDAQLRCPDAAGRGQHRTRRRYGEAGLHLGRSDLRRDLLGRRRRAFVRRGGVDEPLRPSARSLLVDINCDGPLDRPFVGPQLIVDPAFRAGFGPRVISSTLALAWVAAGGRAAYVSDGTFVDNVHFAGLLD